MKAVIRVQSALCVPEVVGTEGWGEALPDEAPPVICPGGEKIGFLLLMSELHGKINLCTLQLSCYLASMPQDSPMSTLEHLSACRRSHVHIPH